MVRGADVREVPSTVHEADVATPDRALSIHPLSLMRIPMNDSEDLIAARLASLHWMRRLYMGVAVVAVAVTLAVFLIFPNVLTGCAVLSAVFTLYVAFRMRQSAHRGSLR